MADPVVDTGAQSGPIAGVPATVVETPAVAAPVTDVAPPVSSEVEAPAVDAPASADAPPAAESAPEPKSLAKTILAEAGKVEDPPKPEDPKAPDAPAAVTEPPPEGEAFKYEAFTLPESVTLDDSQLGKYTEVLGKHQVPQEAVQSLVDLFVAEQIAAAQRQEEANTAVWSRIRDGWMNAFETDPEIGGNRRDTTVKACGAMLERYGQQFGRDRLAALRQDLEITGMGNHPELIRMMNWMSKFATERTKPVAAVVPKAPQPQSRGQRRYAASLNNGAA